MRIGLFAMALLAAGCAREQTVVPVGGPQGTANVSGVQLGVEAQAWEPPPDLAGKVTPLRVTLANGTGVPLRIRYDQFRVLSPTGAPRSVLPPLPADLRSGSLGPLTPEFESESFFVPPPLLRVYPDQGLWAGPFEYRSDGLDGFESWPEGLPTTGMIQRAIPEGVIETGGRVSGFLYFPPLPEGAARYVFEADLVDANTGEGFATVSIPFLPPEQEQK
ncbi:MAG TPA: hypothetical protein DFS52_04720 [Myxococcales bacterium]|jgi:hypothetical protein|nr:hypothetical protein [Myxococcales bacterium]